MPKLGCLVALACVTASLGLVSCKAPKPQTRSAAPTQQVDPKPPEALQRLFTRDLLGEQLSYFESIAGPAMKIAENARVYNVAGCRINVIARDGVVKSAQLELTPACTVNLDEVISGVSFPTPLNRMTLGDFQKAMKTSMHGADCIDECTLEQESVYAWSHGPSPASQVDVVVRAVPDSPANQHAIAAWRDALLSQHGEQWVVDRKYNCDATERDVASPQLAPVRIMAIQIGREMITPDQQCVGEAPPKRAIKTAATGWYLLSLHPPSCERLDHFIPGVYSPENFVSGAARHGSYLEEKRLGDNLVAVSGKGNPNAHSILFARGEAHCHELLRRAASRED